MNVKPNPWDIEAQCLPMESILPQTLRDKFIARFSPEASEPREEGPEPGDPYDRACYLLVILKVSGSAKEFVANFATMLQRLPMTISDPLGYDFPANFTAWAEKRKTNDPKPLGIKEVLSRLDDQFAPEIPGFARRDPSSQAATANRRDGSQEFDYDEDLHLFD